MSYPYATHKKLCINKWIYEWMHFKFARKKFYFFGRIFFHIVSLNSQCWSKWKMHLFTGKMYKLKRIDLHFQMHWRDKMKYMFGTKNKKNQPILTSNTPTLKSVGLEKKEHYTKFYSRKTKSFLSFLFLLNVVDINTNYKCNSNRHCNYKYT